jgi:colicin import membrane protein
MAENEEQAKKDFDKERQAADQERANAARARADAQSARQEAEQSRQRMTQLEADLQAIKGQKDAMNSVDLPEIPTEEASVEALAQYSQKAKKIIAEQARKLAELDQKVSKSEKDKAAETESKRASSYADQVLEEVCTEFDDEFGPNLRNDALKRMTEINKTEGLPQTPHKAMLRLRSCYRDAAKEAKAESKSPRIPSDPGRGGSRPSYKPAAIKPGSLDEVAQQFAKT